MFLKTLFAALTVLAFAAPAAQAQTRRTPDPGTVTMASGSKVSHIGVRLSDVTAEDMKTLKLTKLEGALVEGVNPNSPASTAGLRDKDVVVEFDGERVRSAGHFSRLVSETPAGREVAMAVMRDGRRTVLRIVPEAQERGWFDPRFGEVMESGEWREQVEHARRAAREIGRNIPEVMESMREGMPGPNRARLGVSVQPLSGDLAEYFGVKSGVLVASVVTDSPAAKAGLKAGDVITAINGKAVATSRELVTALPAGDASQDITLTVVREKKEIVVKANLAPASNTDRQTRGQPV
jgi:S1-C subfamily serine protease